MTEAVFAYINNQLTDAGINYEFGEFKGTKSFPYFVGEYNSSPPSEEDCSDETTFILNGFHDGKYIDLERARATIEKLFTFNTGILQNGSGVAVSYAGCLVIPTGDARLKRIQINLSIKEWRVK
jgi:hypothetical protein